MIAAMQQNLEAAGIKHKVGTLVAESGYLSDDNLLTADDDILRASYRGGQRPRPTHQPEGTEGPHP